jgi:hypothetical protein
MKRIVIGTALILGAMLNAAHADTWVFRDIQRPHGHDRSMAVKRADGRKCGARHNAFKDEIVTAFQSCMVARGWTLDHVIPDPSPRIAHGSSESSPPIDNSSNDDWVRRQQDQDNLQQMLNTQQMINDQQMLNDQQFQQNQQQMINNMNNQ